MNQHRHRTDTESLVAYRALLLITAVSILATSCGSNLSDSDDASRSWQGTTIREGPTLTVRTTGGSLWGGSGRLVEETAIGTETRGEYDLLGQVVGMEATADRVYVLDRLAAAIRVYDTAGNHVLSIGRPGQGPGELQAPTALGIDPSRGHLVVRESVAGKLHRFKLSGEYLWSTRPSLQGGIFGAGKLLRVTSDGVTIVPNFAYRRAPDTELGYVSTTILYTLDSTGARVDSLPLPEYEHEQFVLTAMAGRESYRPEPVPFGPQEVWAMGWDGSLVTGYSADYRFEIRYPDGRVTVIERETDPVEVLPGEKTWATDRAYGILRSIDPAWRWNGPGIPATKPWYDDIIPDRSGRLWVLREGEGRKVEGWTEPDGWREWERNPGWVPDRWFEVFEEATGRYLGRVNAPEGFVAAPEPVIEGDRFVCLTEDAIGRPIVRRYRLVLPA